MKVQGEVTLSAAQARVWQALNDDTVLARCTPGCEKLERISDNEYNASLKVGLAGIKGSYDGKLTIVQREEPTLFSMRIDATGGGGYVKVIGSMALAPVSDTTTKIVYDWDVEVGGPVAMVGQRVLGGAAKFIIGEFFKALGKEVSAA